MADSQDPWAIKVKAARSAAKELNSEQLELEAQKIQYIGSMYLSNQFGPCVPTDNILANLSAAARKLRQNQYIQGGYLITGCSKDGNAAEVALHYDGPRDPAELFERPEFRFGRTVVISDARVFKVRPCFLGWHLNFELHVQPEFVKSVELFEDIMRFGGYYYGLGDWLTHPYYGKFTVDILKVNGESVDVDDEEELSEVEVGAE
jgi:hypothetical protein